MSTTSPPSPPPAAPAAERVATPAALGEAAALGQTAALGEAAALPAAMVEAVRTLTRASRLLEEASGEVKLAHYRVLAAIASGDQRASRIAAKLALGKPTVSASVEWLCKRGLLARQGVVGDQRAASLHLTPEGEKWLNAVETAMAAWLDNICARTPEPAQTLQSLVWMGEAIEQIAVERFTEGRPAL